MNMLKIVMVFFLLTNVSSPKDNRVRNGYAECTVPQMVKVDGQNAPAKRGKRVGVYYYFTKYNGEKGVVSRCIRTYFEDGVYCLIESPGYSFQMRGLGGYLPSLAPPSVSGTEEYKSRYEMYREDNTNYYFHRVTYKTTYRLEYITIGYSLITKKVPYVSKIVAGEDVDVIVAKNWSKVTIKNGSNPAVVLEIEGTAKEHDEMTSYRINHFGNGIEVHNTTNTSPYDNKPAEPKRSEIQCKGCYGTGECTACAGRGWKSYGECAVCRGGGRCGVCYGKGSL